MTRDMCHGQSTSDSPVGEIAIPTLLMVVKIHHQTDGWNILKAIQNTGV